MTGGLPAGALADVMSVTPQTGVVRAAGALCWRPREVGGLEVLLVHSARYNEWTWPKGKLEGTPTGTEPLPACAIREVAEETGVTVRLGRPLPDVEYDLPDGRHKRVTYWAATPLATGVRSASEAEISDAVWLPLAAAVERLSRPGDLAPLRQLEHYARRGRLDSHAVVVVRHAKAVRREEWDGEDADRPLNALGERQAAALVRLLTPWAPDRLVTSPWQRCLDTLLPTARARGLDAELRAELTEAAVKEDPGPAGELMVDLVDSGVNAVVCTHRPVLQIVGGALGALGSDNVRRRLPRRDPWLSPAEMLVAHVTREAGRPRVRAVERHKVTRRKDAL